MDIVGEQTLEIMKKADWYNSWLLLFFKKYISGRILEIGAGIGNFTSNLTDYGSVTAIDVDKDYLKKIKLDKVRYGFGDIEKGKYFFRKQSFDTIISLNVIEHIKDDEKAFRNIFKLLDKGGNLILLLPAHDFLYSRYDKLLGHYRRYNIDALKSKLKKCGFGIEEIRYINWWGAIGWFVFIKMLKVQKMPENPVMIFDKLGRIFLLPEKLMRLPIGLSILAVLKK